MKHPRLAALTLCMAAFVAANAVLVRTKTAGFIFEYRPDPTEQCRKPFGIEVRWCTANDLFDNLAACHADEGRVFCGKVEKHLWCVCAFGGAGP